MNHFSTLFDLICGRPLADQDTGRSRRMQILISALLTSLVFAALWGLAAGLHDVVGLAIPNLIKVPMVVLVAAVSAMPAGLLTWKLLGGPGRASDLMLGFAGGTFAGTLVLAVTAPLVAIYYASSVWAGPMLGQGSAILALGVGMIVFARSILGRARKDVSRARMALPMTVLGLVHTAMLVQLIAVAAPILPERNAFSHGIDHLGDVAR